MKIVSINPIFYTNKINTRKNFSQTSVKEKSDNDKTYPIAFMAIPTNSLKKTTITNKELKKVFLLAKNFPNNCETSTLRFITLNGEPFAYKIKKDGTGRTNIEIKNKINDMADWDKTFDIQQSLECNFSPRGILVGAKALNKKAENSSEIIFEHKGHAGRRISINDKIYKPISGKNNLWGIISNGNPQNIIGKENIATKLEKDLLSYTLFELASNRISIAQLDKE